METRRKTVITSLIWRLMERYGAQIVQFIVSILLARILLPEIYGTVALITIFITILQVFVEGGFGTALVQKKDADDLDFSTVFYFNLVLCGVLYLLMFLLAPVIAGFYNNGQLTIIIRVLSLAVVFSSLKNVQQAYVSRTMQFKKFFFSTLFGTLVSAVVGVVMAYKGFGVWALVAQNLTNLCLDTLILWITVKWRPKWMFSFARLKVLFKYGWKLLASSLLNVTYENLSQLIIGKRYSTTDLAYYNKGHQFPNIIIENINTSIDSVMFPTLSKEQDNKEAVKNMTRRAIKTSSYLIAPMMIGLAVTAGGVVRLVLTEKWMSCVPFLQIFCLTFMFYPIHTANLTAMKAVGRSDYFLKLEIIKKIFGLSIIFATMFISVKAMAIGTVVSSVLGIIINSYPNKKLINYTVFEQIKDILPNFVLAGVMGVCVWGLSFIPIHYVAVLFIQIFVGISIYIIGSAITKNETFSYVLNIFKNFKHKKENK